MWYGTVSAGILAYEFMHALCPSDLMVSGQCTADWFSIAIDLLVLAFSGLAAFGMVVVPTLLAPSRKSLIARFSFLVGVSFAIYLVASGGKWTPFAVAVFFGSVALRMVLALLHRQPAVA